MNDAVALARLRILSLAAVTALVSTKVYGGMLEQSVVPPAVLVQRVGEVARGHLRGGNRLWITRIQVTSVAMSRSAAVTLDQAIYGDGAGSGLAFWIGGIGSPAVDVRLCDPAGVVEDYVAGELRQWRVLRDYLVHHR
jgi:hypothetical protein